MISVTVRVERELGAWDDEGPLSHGLRDTGRHWSWYCTLILYVGPRSVVQTTRRGGGSAAKARLASTSRSLGCDKPIISTTRKPPPTTEQDGFDRWPIAATKPRVHYMESTSGPCGGCEASKPGPPMDIKGKVAAVDE